MVLAALLVSGLSRPKGQGIVMAMKTFTVTGMTCSHCVNSVGAEISNIAGVTDVRVDLTSGAVAVTSEWPVDDAAVAAAVDDAGYTLARP